MKNVRLRKHTRRFMMNSTAPVQSKACRSTSKDWSNDDIRITRNFVVWILILVWIVLAAHYAEISAPITIPVPARIGAEF